MIAKNYRDTFQGLERAVKYELLSDVDAWLAKNLSCKYVEELNEVDKKGLAEEFSEFYKSVGKYTQIDNCALSETEIMQSIEMIMDYMIPKVYLKRNTGYNVPIFRIHKMLPGYKYTYPGNEELAMEKAMMGEKKEKKNSHMTKGQENALDKIAQHRGLKIAHRDEINKEMASKLIDWIFGRIPEEEEFKRYIVK